MKLNLVHFAALVSAYFLLPQVSVVQADVFEIRGGGIITGKLLNDPKSPIFKIRTNDGIEIEIASGKLKQPVTVSPEVQAIYKSMAGKQDSAELHEALGLELNRLKSPLAYAHLERLVELDPTDVNWGRLSHAQNKQTGEWERTEVGHKRKGLMYSQTSRLWETPQSQAIVKHKSAEKHARGEMLKLFNQHLKNLDSKTPKLSSAAAEFFALLSNSEAFYEKYQVQNRFAIQVMSDLLLNPKSAQTASPDFLMDLLAKMPDNMASAVFVEIARESPSAQLQQQALELLNRTAESREYAFLRFWSELNNPDTKDKQYLQKVDRAGSNIQGFADKRAIPVLIDRLNSLATATITTPGSNTFNRDGSGGGMSTGGTQKIERVYQHQSILTALLGLADGESYSYNQQAWREWYAYKYAKTNMDLRRDE